MTTYSSTPSRLHLFSSADLLSWSPSWTEAVVGALLLAASCQWLITYLDVPLLSIPEYLWNAFVWLMPSTLVLGWGRHALPGLSGATAEHESAQNVHAAKSEVLRSVFGLGGARALPKDNEPSAPGVRSPKGLGNWDNSCYQNSVLQALSSLKSFTTYLQHAMNELDRIPSGSTINSFSDLAYKLNQGSSGDRYIWTPAKLKSMSSWQQQDAQEYFSKIADEMEKEIKVAIADEQADEQSKGGIEEAVMLNAKVAREAIQKSLEPPVHSMPTDGLLAQRVGCTRCGYSEGLSLIPFNCLTLPLGNNSAYDVEQCLDEYTALDSIEGVECGKCTLIQAKDKLERLAQFLASSAEKEQAHFPTEQQKDVKVRLSAVDQALEDEDFSETTLTNKCRLPSKVRVSTTKSRQAVVMRAPKALIIHINRSIFDEMTGEQRKNYADVQCGEHLDLSPWCLGAIEASGGLIPESWNMDPTQSMLRERSLPSGHVPTTKQYDLKALVTHYGRHENGHYVCYRKLPPQETKNIGETADSQWWRISDETVYKVTTDETLGQGGGFMLFYERLDQASSPQTTTEPTTELVAASTADTQEAEDELNESTETLRAPHQELDLDEPVTLVQSVDPNAEDEEPSDIFKPSNGKTNPPQLAASPPSVKMRTAPPKHTYIEDRSNMESPRMVAI